MINQILDPCPLCGTLPEVIEAGGSTTFAAIQCPAYRSADGPVADRHFVKVIDRDESMARAKWNRRRVPVCSIAG